ncbi:15947_t:CDS:1, partial [Racocetra persica]
LTTENPNTTKIQTTINSLLERRAEITQPLSEEKQIRVTYHLVAWLIEAMMPLDCINHDRFKDFCYEINPRFGVP